MSRRTRIAVLLSATLLSSGTAQAFWGVGDVTYDPSNYSELLAIFAQLEDTYKTTMDSYRTMTSMEATIRQTREDYQQIRNFKLSHSIRHMNFRELDQRVKTLTQDVGSLQDKTANGDYGLTQLDNIQDLNRLQLVQEATDENANFAASGIKTQGDADVVTAQSTATLASLAAEAASERRVENIGRNVAAKAQADAFKNQGTLINALKH